MLGPGICLCAAWREASWLATADAHGRRSGCVVGSCFGPKFVALDWPARGWPQEWGAPIDRADPWMLLGSAIVEDGINPPSRALGGWEVSACPVTSTRCRRRPLRANLGEPGSPCRTCWECRS